VKRKKEFASSREGTQSELIERKMLVPLSQEKVLKKFLSSD